MIHILNRTLPRYREAFLGETNRLHRSQQAQQPFQKYRLTTDNKTLLRIIPIPYYKLSATLIEDKIQEVWFETNIYGAYKGANEAWKYDFVIGKKPK